MLMFSLAQFLSITLKGPSCWASLMEGGRWFQLVADLTMKDLLDVDFSTIGTNSVP